MVHGNGCGSVAGQPVIVQIRWLITIHTVICIPGKSKGEY